MCKKFETIGQNLQATSKSIKEANERLAMSCKICSKKGLEIDCEKCEVKVANSLKIAALATTEEPSK